jgi:hypothetical protein
MRDVEPPAFFLDSRLTDGAKVVSPLPNRKIPGTHLCYETEKAANAQERAVEP